MTLELSALVAEANQVQAIADHLESLRNSSLFAEQRGREREARLWRSINQLRHEQAALNTLLQEAQDQAETQGWPEGQPPAKVGQGMRQLQSTLEELEQLLQQSLAQRQKAQASWRASIEQLELKLQAGRHRLQTRAKGLEKKCRFFPNLTLSTTD